MNKATLKKFFLNFIGIALLCSPLLLMLPPVQAFTSRMTYYATLPYARIPYALVNINVEATYFNGSTASVRDLT
ncbi:MAG: hypothetical protein ACPLGZ_02395, partial [Candidatus Pelagibacter ubique]